MGRVADFFREQNIPLAQQQRAKMVSLDGEIEELEAKVQILETENLHLKAEVNPLKREVERLKNQVEQKKTPTHVALNAVTEVLLKLIANNPKYVVGNLFDSMGLSQAQLDHHLDILKARDFIIVVSTGRRGPTYNATPTGRKYLVDNDLI